MAETTDKRAEAIAAFEAAAVKPAAPADDEARIAKWWHEFADAMLTLRHDCGLRVYDRDMPNDVARNCTHRNAVFLDDDYRAARRRAARLAVRRGRSS